VKLYLDEDISPKVAVVLRKKGLDAVSAHEIGMLGASDEQQLSFAADEERAMVTRNRDDFITLTVRFFEDLKPHHGLIIVPHTIPGYQFSTLATSLVKFSKNYTHGMEPYTIEFLPYKK
jgi:predicted nuclease of predicted toxin-antitoxin system